MLRSPWDPLRRRVGMQTPLRRRRRRRLRRHRQSRRHKNRGSLPAISLRSATMRRATTRSAAAVGMTLRRPQQPRSRRDRLAPARERLGQVALSANVVCVSMRHTIYACSIGAELRSVREQYRQSTPNFVGSIFCLEHVHRGWHATDMLIFVFPSARGADFATQILAAARSLAIGEFCVREMRVHFRWSPFVVEFARSIYWS